MEFACCFKPAALQTYSVADKWNDHCRRVLLHYALFDAVHCCQSGTFRPCTYLHNKTEVLISKYEISITPGKFDEMIWKMGFNLRIFFKKKTLSIRNLQLTLVIFNSKPEFERDIFWALEKIHLYLELQLDFTKIDNSVTIIEVQKEPGFFTCYNAI